ncbi:putative sodium-dependent multivitamin transporter [Parasteatoda tepidariorum]|uniref:putative sodium-dependent multivitamin transporter n=1 Tax=Parasteatoda tepidariorum TaxID=114398 RepID=UPI001C723498|nr:putative sodium-dependent multivitamin transporter [Parasteatoda tepidariorum]
MFKKYSLGVADYVIISLTLLLSIGIGLCARYFKGQQKIPSDYLLAGKNMPKFPVIFSIIVTLTSTSSFLSSPAEVYKYGIAISIANFMMPIGMFISSSVIIPVYFQCEVSSITEYLEMRYGRIIRYLASVMFLLQMVFYMSISLYGAVLALSAVTDLSFELSIVSLGTVCAFYCSLGGLKAVLWTDVFQAILMTTCLLAIYIAGISDAGGISDLFRKVSNGKRLNFFELMPDVTRRYGFWACATQGIMVGMAFFGTNQVEVQRLLSLSDIKRAKSTLRMSSLPMCLMYSACCYIGVVLYGVYYNCDPILDKERTGLRKYDQIVPAYIVTRFSSYPGLTGLCIAGIFSASMSTISSCLNSASTVTVIDYLIPIFRKGNISDLKIILLAKIVSAIYGGVCIGLSFAFRHADSIHHLNQVFVALPQGIICAVFLFGMLTRKAGDKCISFAVVVTYVIMAWIALSSLYAGYVQPLLPLSNSMCPSSQNQTMSDSIFNISSSTLPSPITEKNHFVLYKMTFMWYSFIGFFLTFLLTAFAALITGWKKNAIPADSKCLSPVTKFWMKKNQVFVQQIK